MLAALSAGRRSASAEEATLSGTRGPRRAGVGLHISQIEKVSEMILEAMVAEGISWDRSFFGLLILFQFA